MGTVGGWQGSTRSVLRLFFVCSSSVLRLFFVFHPTLPARRQPREQNRCHTIRMLQENLGRKRFCKGTKSRGHLQAAGEIFFQPSDLRQFRQRQPFA